MTIGPEGSLIVGACGSGNIYKVNPVNGTFVTATSGGGSCHLSLDPSRTKAWAGFSYGGSQALSEIPLTPFGNGTARVITGDDTAVGTLAWNADGNCYYVVSQPGGIGSFGLLNTNTFVTKRFLANVAAAHGMAYDPATASFILFGDTHITQIKATATNAVIIGDLDFTGKIGVDFDQGTVDGLGHIFAAENGGNMLFVDYSLSGNITNSFTSLKYLDSYLDDVAPVGLVGNGNLADISATATAAPTPAMVRSNLVITFTVTNAGPKSASGVTLSELLPANAEFVSIAANAGVAAVENGKMTASLASLPAGQSLIVTLTIRPISGPLVNHAVVLANESDPNFANNLLDFTIIAPEACLPPAQGIIGWWPGDGNGLDAISTNHATLGRPQSFAPGRVGGAFYFDGVRDNVNIPDRPELRPASLTAECWISADNYSSIRSIMGKAYGGGDDDSFAVWMQDGVLHGYTRLNTGGSAVMSYNLYPLAGTWYHIAFTHDDATGKEFLYVDGAVVASQTVNGHIAYDAHPLQIGADYSNEQLNYRFIGRIDEAAFYNRALTAAEINSIIAAGALGKCTTPVLVPTTLQSGATNRPYSRAITLAHASPATTISLSQGALPPGLSLSADGVIAGTPTTVGSYAFKLRGIDASGGTAETTYGLQINAPASMPAGLLAWYRGESNAVDELGQHNGTPNGGISYVPGYNGAAFKFDGNNGYVDLGNWSPGTRWTVEAWVNPSLIQGGRRAIVSGFQECQDWGIAMQDGQIVATARQPGGCSFNLLSGIFAQPGTWYHIAETVNGTNAVVYVNGTPLATNVVDPNYLATPKGARIGGSVCCGEYFAGLVDEVAIFNRALEASEISAVYAAGVAGRLPVGAPPRVTASPTNTIGTVFGSTTLCANVATADSTTFQWYRNNIPINGATGACLNFPSLALADAGFYSVAVGNANGTIVTPAVVLTVLDLKQYAGITINGTIGSTYRIDFATPANPNTWTALTTVTLTSASTFFVDTASAGQAARLYRVVKTQ